MRAQAALPGRARPWHLLHWLRTFLVFLKPFFIFGLFQALMKGEGSWLRQKSLYVLQCCLQICMGSFNMSAARFPHNFEGEG